MKISHPLRAVAAAAPFLCFSSLPLTAGASTYPEATVRPSASMTKKFLRIIAQQDSEDEVLSKTGNLETSSDEIAVDAKAKKHGSDENQSGELQSFFIAMTECPCRRFFFLFAFETKWTLTSSKRLSNVQRYPLYPVFKSKGHKANIAATTNKSGKVSKELPSQGLSSTTNPKAEKGGSKISSSDSGDPSEDAKFPPAGDDDALLCSCAPTAYSLKLNFNGKCNDYDTLASVDGIDGSICFFAQGADELDDVSVGAVDLPDGGGDGTRRRTLELVSSRPVLMGYNDATADNDESGHKRRQDSTSEKEQWWVRATFSDYDFSSQLDHAREIQARRQRLRRMQEQEDDFSLQDTTPATITSMSFFEADTTASFNILYEEVTYFDMEGGELTDGDVLNYTSISSKLDSARPINDQMELVPGGVMLLLFGSTITMSRFRIPSLGGTQRTAIAKFQF